MKKDLSIDKSFLVKYSLKGTLSVLRIQKAKEACKNSDSNVLEHFGGADKLSKRANNAEVLMKQQMI